MILGLSDTEKKFKTAMDTAGADMTVVNSWLKQRLIKDFFGLLAADGAADFRRLEYWLKWEPQISDMWFVLGSDAQGNRTPEFLDLRKRMSGRDRKLVDSNHLNNAFVMRIGQLLVIEFGVTGNACYVFATSDFQTSLDNAVLNLHQLKQKAYAKRLSHTAQWEFKFDYELKKLLQSVPMSKGELKEFNPTSNTPNAVVHWRAQSTPVTAPKPVAPSLLTSETPCFPLPPRRITSRASIRSPRGRAFPHERSKWAFARQTTVPRTPTPLGKSRR